MGSSFSFTFLPGLIFLERGRGLVCACFPHHFLTALFVRFFYLVVLNGGMDTCVGDTGQEESLGNNVRQKEVVLFCIGIFVYYLYYISLLLIFFLIVYLSRYALIAFTLLSVGVSWVFLLESLVCGEDGGMVYFHFSVYFRFPLLFFFFSFFFTSHE